MKAAAPTLWVVAILTALTSALPSAQGQTSVLPATLPAAWNLFQPDGTYATRSVIFTPEAPFAQAIRVQTRKRPANAWDIQLNITTTQAVAKDDVLEAQFWLRRVAPAGGEAFAEFVFEQNRSPWVQSTTRFAVEGDGLWTRIHHAFKAAQAYPAGQAQVNIRLGYLAAQTLDIGGVTVTNHARTRSLADFPETVTYPGRTPDAPWRAAAEARIETLRKSELTLEVLSPDGLPAAGVPVEVMMTRHAFAFGSAVDGARLMGRSGGAFDRQRYQNVITGWFNRVVLENDLKWPVWEGPAPYGSNNAIAALKWLRDRDVEVRGHNLIWPGTSASYYLPTDVRGLLGNPAALAERVNRHFTNILGATQGLCREWDVINEPYANHDVQDALGGRSVMLDWFRLAKRLAPDARLYLNEYGNLELAGLDSPHTTHFFDTLAYLQQGGAPVEGIGMQAHFASYLPHPERLLQMLDRFATLGLPIQATEFDINTRDEQAQADFTRDFLTVMFSHPSANGVLMWGFWEGQHWLPDAALFRRNWEIKPSGIAWSNLVLNTWWTRTNVVTGPDGTARVRGFKGTYRITPAGASPAGATVVDLDSARTVRLTSIGRPRLEIDAASSQIQLQWSGDATGWRLESSPTLYPPAWAPETSPPQQTSGLWRWTASPTAPSRYFRLTR